MAKKRSETWWCIFAPHDYGLLPYSCRVGRSNCIWQFEQHDKQSWSKLYRQGYRCVKIKVKEISNGK